MVKTLQPNAILLSGKSLWFYSGPELLFACCFHRSLAFGAGLFVPDTDVVAAAVQAETAYLAPVGRRHISNNTPNYDVLNGLAVRTAHGGNLLAEEAAALVSHRGQDTS